VSSSDKDLLLLLAFTVAAGLIGLGAFAIYTFGGFRDEPTRAEVCRSKGGHLELAEGRVLCLSPSNTIVDAW
jgi:hypothetical protein